MAATFNVSLTSDRDYARLLLGDTDVPTNALHQDETYDKCMTDLGFNLGVALLADSLVTRFAQEPEEYEQAESGASIKLRERLKAWKEIASKLRSGEIDLGKLKGDTAYIVRKLKIPTMEGFRPA